MAEYFAPTAVENVTNQAKECALPYLRYFFGYGEIVEDFTNQRKALKLRKQRVKTRVDETKRKIEVIYEDVEDWLRSAEKELEETQNLEDEIDSVRCFKWCPKWGWRYCLSKKLAEKTPIISKLLEASNFPQVGYRGSLQGIEFITSTDFMDSESSKSALNQIMEAINGKGVNMIGLHGMPGVGKTTLAQEVGKHAREQKLFDKVVMFTMSQNPNINKIQDKVADIFGLNFETSSREGKEEVLFRSMQGVNKILVIVDDLWEELKLESIGIPFGDEHKGCKILLTTRDQQVCTKMNCQKEIQLGILSEDEAWVLFRDKAGLDDDSSTLNDVAKEVAAQCKGLPLAIVVVAKALKGESLNGWTTVNQRFKESRHLDNEKVLGGVLKPLKLSYDYLKEGNSQMTGNDIQVCFLLCSLFPEDYEISLEILIMCGIGVGLFPNAYSIEDTRNEIVMALKKLQKSGLLLGTDDAKRIRMHDVVRDFAHWLTSTGENRFMVKDELKEWHDMDGCYTVIALWNCSSNIKKFPDKVEFSKLKSLILEGDWDCDWNWDLRQKRKRKRGDLLVVSSIFFEEMKALQVLYLESVSFSPIGFHSLPNLKTLCCVHCELENFSSSLKNMRSLEILALIGTKIDEISEELVKLFTLKYLRLSGIGVEEEMNIHPNLISRLTSLQELHVISKSNINLLELNLLSRLTALPVILSTNQISQEYFVFPKLQRYAIVVDDCFRYLKAQTLKTLTVANFSSSLSAFNNLFCNVKKLKLRNVSGQKNIVPSIGKTGVNELTSLKLASCKDIEFLIDITSGQGPNVVFSNLVKLNIHNMVSLKGLCCGLSRSHRAIASLTRLKVNDCRLCFWPKLRILHIQSCKSLKYVCASNSTQGLQSLEFLHISHCPQFMQIFNMEQNENGQDIVLPGFRSQGLVISNVGIIWKTNVPVLNEDCIVVGNHEEVFQVQGRYLFSRIKELDLKNLFEVRIIWNDFAQVVTLENLTTLKLRDCKKLRYIFSPTTAHSLSHLVNLFNEGCEEIEQLILAKDQVSSSSSSNGDTGLQPISFPNLTNITVRNCGNLKSLFPLGHVPILPKLECLKLKTNSKLEEVFKLEDEVEVTAEKEMKFDKLEWLSLEELPGLIHFCPKGYHFVLSALKVLTVRDSPKLTTGFFIDSQEFVHCKTKTHQLVEQNAIQNQIFNKNINWNWR
ncbi:hypothetical protein E1A91_A04G021500v1 [Gossypium mustelinum]|uniref:AAA+ ATPase domain-containing protein n=1 Tax=Gossypium mustelinum TaxID=34275 RepID=A0A5D2ZJY4_GOSMU|nr:hypothetical protein E1A91_A04G021500v1 [Gossypium mustelinum]